MSAEEGLFKVRARHVERSPDVHRRILTRGYRTEFYAVALAKEARCCKSCWKAKQSRRRSGTAAARMLHTLKNRLRGEGNGVLARRWELGGVEIWRRNLPCEDGA